MQPNRLLNVTFRYVMNRQNYRNPLYNKELKQIFGWFKRSLNQSIGSLSANPHFALLWSDERSDILGIVSDHWGMVTYNFFWNNFFGSLIRTQSGAEFVMYHSHFGILQALDLL